MSDNNMDEKKVDVNNSSSNQSRNDQGGDRNYRGGDRNDRGGDRGNRGGHRGGGGGGRRGKMFFKRKFCKFCAKKGVINFKDVDGLRRYVTEKGKIIPQRITGTCAKHQRELTRAIKRARTIAMLPFVDMKK